MGHATSTRTPIRWLRTLGLRSMIRSEARFAPCFASFDPTDLAAISHVRRMYHKYPKMWRGIGIMCRHDDLTTMLLGKEIPRVNHPALSMPSTNSR